MSGSHAFRRAFFAVIAAALTYGGLPHGSPVAHAAGALSDYRLLVLNGMRAKWGSPVPGTGVTLTYAVTARPLHTDGAINCSDIAPVDGLLTANQIRRADFDRQLEAAFGAWSAVADISFVRADDPAKADILIGAEGTAGGRAFTNVTTRPVTAPVTRLAASGTEPGTITRSLICLNPDQRWKIGFDGNLDVYDLRYSLMHEIGHAIGLDHPDSVNAVMDFHYTERFSTLQPGDIAGALAIYGTRRPVATIAATPRGLAAAAPPMTR